MIVDGSTLVRSSILSLYSLYAGNWCFLVFNAALCSCHFCSYSALVLGRISSNTDVLLSGTVDPNHVVVAEIIKQSTHKQLIRSG